MNKSLFIYKKETWAWVISCCLIFLIGKKLVEYHRSPAKKELSIALTQQLNHQEANIVLGNDDAPITMILYYNYACNSCRLFMSETFLSVKRDFIDEGLVKAILKPVEFEDNKVSRLDMEAILCMDKMGLFYPMNEYLLLRHDTYQSTQALMNEFASLNNELLLCIETNESQQQILRNNQELQQIMGTSTPTIVLNNKIYLGSFPYTAFKRLLERELK